MNWDYLIYAPWIVFAVSWTIGVFRTRPTVKRDRLPARYIVLAIVGVGFYLLLSHDAAMEALGQRVLPRTVELRIVGAVLLWAGVGLALWARWHLGQYWSGRITIKEGHKLIRTGPYARLRHPIYSGLVLAAAGTAIEVDRWHGISVVCIVLFGFWIKARREEALLAEHFGAEFEEHRRATGFLLPKLRSS